MGFIIGIVRRLIKFTIYLTIFAAIIILIPNLPPYTEFSSIQFESTLPRDGPLAPNTALNNAKKMYLNKVHGPEAFVTYNGELYTGMATGEVVKISPGGHVTFVTKIGKACIGDWQEHICGRPLGLDINKKEKQLYVVDAYYGIWKVDLKTDKKQLLVSPTVEIEKRVPKIFNDIVLGKNGDFYWTESSSDFSLKDGIYTMLADPTGRLHYYNAAKNQSKVLIDGLWFANGVAISPDDQFVVIAESAGYTLHRYYINGPKRGQKDVLLQGLPGIPDNIQVLPDGSGMLVGLYAMFDEQHPLLFRSMAPAPLVRKCLSRILKLIEVPFEFANSLYPHYFFEHVTFLIGNFRSVAKFTPPMSGLLHIDWNGKINGLYMSTDPTLQSISDAIVFNDKMYIGSPHNNFIGAVPVPEILKNAFNTIPVPVKTAETVTEKIPLEKTASKPLEQKPVKTKEDPVKKAQETEKKEYLNEPPKEAPKQQKPTEQFKPTEPSKKESPKTTTSKPQVEQRPTTQSPKKPEPKVSTTTPLPPKQTAPPTPKPSSQAKEAKPVQSTITPPQAQKESTPKPVASPETKPKTQPKESAKKHPEKPKVVEPEVKQRKIEPEIKRMDKSKIDKVKETPKKTTSIDKNSENRKVPEQIPIKEEIPSDTIKPDAAKLKVIKKEGPAEIPNPKI